MKKVSFWTILICFYIFVNQGLLKAQGGGCNEITFVIEHYEPCKFRIQYDNSSECYTELHILLSKGTFVTWEANASEGWAAELINPSEIKFTHISGIIPIGANIPGAFSIFYGFNPVLTVLWDYSCPLGKSCIAEFPLEGCQVITDACIDGFIYKECEELPFINQEVLSGWTVEIFDEIGNVLGNEVTGSDGAYSFCDLPGGLYTMQLTPKEGWSPKFPLSGKATIILDPSEIVEQNFGVCQNCFCATPSFSNLYLRGSGGPSSPMYCETSNENIGCPDPGYGFILTGLFECAGDSCDTQPYIYWDLIGPLGGSVASGSTPGPYFGVNLWPAYSAQPGIYTMELSGFCNFDTCTCEFQFIVDCPAQCPCDINDLQADVNQGFNHVLLPQQCQACFTPIALNECDSIYWYISNPNGTPIGSSVGNNSFCYTFPGSGTYTIFMEVTRKKPDGSNCEKFRKSQTVKISCGISPLCDNSAFSNPTFSESAVAGGFYSGGSSFGWYGLLGEPVVTVGVEGSSDGWTIQLWGNLDTSAVLTHLNAICLERDTGTITLRTEEPKKKKPPFVGPDPKNENLKFHIFQGDIFDPDNCNGIDCYELASIPISALPLDEWYEVQIPYDLRGKLAMDTCTGGQGVLVRPAIFVSNIFGSNQGGSETYSSVHIDDLCFNGTIVAVNDPGQASGIRIFPNPTTGALNIQMPIIQQSDISLQVISLTGHQLLEKRAEPGITVQTMDASLWPQGMYFLQILSKGQVIAVNKFVKQ